MPVIQTNELSEMTKLSMSLYDPETGELIVAKGDALTEDMLKEIAKSGFTSLFATNDEEEIQKLRKDLNFDALTLLSIEPDTAMASDLYDESGKFLIAKNTKLTTSILSSLARRKVKTVLIRKNPDAKKLQKITKLKQTFNRNKENAEGPKLEETKFNKEDLFDMSSGLNVKTVQRMSKKLEAEGNMKVTFDSKDSLEQKLVYVDPFEERNEKVKVKFVDIYIDLLKRTELLFQNLADERHIDSKTVTKMCDDVVQALVGDRELLLCSMFSPRKTRNYLAKHSLNVAIISVNIATAHGYSAKMVVEVAYGALLMDIGMIKVPESIRNKVEKLTLIEINELKRHTIYGMDRLQYIRHLPQTTPLVAYQSHERLDGSGYPHGKRTHAIHDYSKITAVADVYHAMIDERPYKKTVKLPYKAMEELLQMSAKNKLDKRFVKSLLAAVSLFPVASWVKLNTGEVARVLRANEQDYTKPYIVILYNEKEEVMPPLRINLADEENRIVVSAVKIQTEDHMIGF